MRRSRSRAGLAAALALAACGPAHVFHKEPEAACGAEAITLASREDVARLAGCKQAGPVTIRTAGALDLSALARLEAIEGDLVVGPSVGLEELALPRLVRIRGKLRVTANGNLRGVFLPKLEAAARVEIEDNVAVSTVALPRLARTDALVIRGDAELELVDLSALTAVAGELVLENNPKLTVVEGGPVTAGTVRIENNPQLPRETIDRVQASMPPS